MSSSHQPWWSGGVLYQAYPRSFADSNGDGIGDLAGLRGRLDYLHWLGVDGIWLNPTFPSPNRDWGYDVSQGRGREGCRSTTRPRLRSARRGLRASPDPDERRSSPTVTSVTEQRADPGSVLSFCREAIARRRGREDLTSGAYTPIARPTGVWAWRRGGATGIAINLTDSEATAPLAGKVLLSTRGRDDPSRLEPWEGVVVALT